MRAYITLAVFIIIAGLSFWLRQDVTKQAAIEKTPDSHFPDYFMENFSVTNMNKKGQVEYVLKAVKMLHYADDETAELEQPFISFNQDGNKTTLQASRALFSEKEGTVILHDNIVIQRNASEKQTELSIYTDYLKINTNTQLAETHLTAQVKTAEANLTSLGLVFDNKRGTLLLQSQVKGVYEKNH